jgi:hypothetical protein
MGIQNFYGRGVGTHGLNQLFHESKEAVKHCSCKSSLSNTIFMKVYKVHTAKRGIYTGFRLLSA